MDAKSVCTALFFVQNLKEKNMEKEQILSEIGTRLGQTSLSQRTLSDYVDGNLPAEGTEPDDAYWESTWVS